MILRALTLTSLVARLGNIVDHVKQARSVREPDCLHLKVSVTQDITAHLELPLHLR